jgi:hypothetical protein
LILTIGTDVPVRAEHLAARIESIGIKDQRAVTAINARTAAGGLDQGAQDRRGPFGIDGEAERI